MIGVWQAPRAASGFESPLGTLLKIGSSLFKLVHIPPIQYKAQMLLFPPALVLAVLVVATGGNRAHAAPRDVNMLISADAINSAGS